MSQYWERLAWCFQRVQTLQELVEVLQRVLIRHLEDLYGTVNALSEKVRTLNPTPSQEKEVHRG